MEIILRKWGLGDIDAILAYANNPKIEQNLRDGFPIPYTKEAAGKFIQSCIEGDETIQINRAIEFAGQAIGSIGIFFKSNVYRKSVEIGYWVGEPFWGKGIATKAIRQMTEYVLKNHDIIRVFAEPFAYNIASRKALEKAGYTLEGIKKKSVIKHDIIYDSCIYAFVLIGL